MLLRCSIIMILRLVVSEAAKLLKAKDLFHCCKEV